MIRPRFRVLACGLLLSLAGGAQAAPQDFPQPSALRPQVEFWKKIFGVYSSQQIVFHDDRYPNKILKVLDFRPLAASGASNIEIERRMRTEEKRVRAQLQNSLWRVHKAAGGTAGLNAEELRLRQLYADLRGASRYVLAQDRIRTQRGLKEKTRNAVVISGRYMPRMEAVFRSYGLPTELTRIPFVESSFNVKAYSKVGAAGVWQFMPSSARHYMRLNEVVDDRRDPWFSTEAAARHLRDDYRMLQDWGLAVTAYNHGRQGVAKAARIAGSRDIADIVRRYSSRTFAFASRNFYTEFLAALEVERNYVQYFGPLRRDPPQYFDEVSTQHYVNFPTLARLADMTVEQFHELNPAFHPHVVSGRMRVPPQTRLRVPQGRSASFQAQYAGLGPQYLFSAQRHYYASHRVKRGETPGGIARRYGVRTAALQAANGLRKSSRIRVGQVLKIPPRDGGGAVRVASAPSSPKKSTAAAKPAAKKKYFSHKVQSGQTLHGIARRYGTNVRSIQAANSLSGSRIKPGQVLKIPAS